MEIHKFKQRSREWHEIRVGRVGGSDAIGLTTAARMRTLLFKVVSEIMTGEQEEYFISQVMQDGIDLEPEAISFYEKKTMTEVRDVGYVTNTNFEYLGLSPDGLIGSKGALEIKCPTPKTHAEIIITDRVPARWRPQIAHYFIMMPDLEWVDFMSYCPKFKERKGYRIRCTREDMKKEVANQVIQYAIFKKRVEDSLELFK